MFIYCRLDDVVVYLITVDLMMLLCVFSYCRLDDVDVCLFTVDLMMLLCLITVDLMML